ncbi:MAG: EAL domain-containing protein [Novosphingobium sp.]
MMQASEPRGFASWALGHGADVADVATMLIGTGSLLFSLAGNNIPAVALLVCAMTLDVLGRIRGAIRFRRVLATNVRQREEAAELARRLSLDSLTGHLNRLAFQERLNALATCEGGVGLIILIFFDLNRFKEVNDTLGHDIGDLLLIEVGARARSVLPDALAIARLGGDEYAAMLRWTHDGHAAASAQAIVDAMNQPFYLRDRWVEVSAAVGVAIGDPAVHGGEELLRRADVAMYEVKGTGGGAYHIFDDMLSNRQLRETTIRTELARASFADRFMQYYQPIVCARTGRIEKAEALLRTSSSSLIGVPPSMMVSVAEDSGQIVALTEWTVDTALAAAKRLDTAIAVNLSPLYFRHANFADHLIDRLLRSGCSPSSLIVEVTEGVLISDITSARASIDQLRAIGIEVYLDDFGTGYSSLSYLQNFELDGMKLDRSFIQKLGSCEKTVRIIRSMVDFSHSLDMACVVEGVESDWQARILQLQGCDYLQGFEFAVPMPLEDFAVMLDENRRAFSGQADNGAPHLRARRLG